MDSGEETAEEGAKVTGTAEVMLLDMRMKGVKREEMR